MTIKAQCPHCGQSYSLKDDVAGRQVRCSNPSCQQGFIVPSAAPPKSSLMGNPTPPPVPAPEPKPPKPHLATKEDWQELKRQFPLKSYFAAFIGRGLLTALLVFVLFYLARAWSVQKDSGVERLRREMQMSIPELAYARGTEYSHLLLPDGRITVYAYDKERHEADRERIEKLFPDPEERKQVLDWGEQIFEGCRTRYRVRLWRDTSFNKKDQEQFNALLELKPSEGLKAHSAWQRLTCGPGVQAADLERVEEIVRGASPQHQRLLRWADFRRKQRHHEVRFLVEDEEQTLVVRPLVPDLDWFRYWMVYEEWGVTEPVFEARKQDFLNCCGADSGNSTKKWEAVQKLGKQYAEERRQGGDDSLPDFDDRVALIAVIDRFSGLDPVFSPRLEEASSKHLERKNDEVDASYSISKANTGADLLRLMINTEEWGTAFEPTLEGNWHWEYAIVELAPDPKSADGKPEYHGAEQEWMGAICGTCLLLIPFCWLVMVSIHFLTVDVPGMGLLLMFNPRYRRFAQSFDQNAPIQLSLWIALAIVGWFFASMLPGETPLRTLLEQEQKSGSLLSYLFLIVLGSILTQTIDNIVIVIFLRLGIDPFRKGMVLDNLIAGGLAAMLLLSFGTSMSLVLLSIGIGTLTPLFLEKMGVSFFEETAEGARERAEYIKTSWGCSGITALILLAGIGIDMLFASSIGLNPLEKRDSTPPAIRPTDTQPVWWKAE